MANEDRPFGLRPVRYMSGQPYNGAANPYYLPSGYGTAMFIGDPVILTGTSNTAAVRTQGAHYNIGTLNEVNKVTLADATTAAHRPIGVIVGFAPLSSNPDAKWNPASTERVCFVADDPRLIFEIQANGAIPAASMGLNGFLIQDHQGSTVTGLSGLELDTTGTAPQADASNPLLIWRAVNREDNDTTLIWAKVLVLIGVHNLAHGSNAATDGILGV